MRKNTIQYLSLSLFLGLLLWGGVTFLLYLGAPIHQVVLLDDAGRSFVKEACASGNAFCMGVAALYPFLTHFIARAAPFLWYVVLSLIVFGAVVGWHMMQTGSASLRFRFTPLKVLLLFVGLLWLLFTSLSLAEIAGSPERRLVEPIAAVYPTASPEVLATLQKNFQDLNDRGCLTEVGEYGNGAKVYDLSQRCIQTSFFTRVVPPLLFVLVLLLEFLVAGRFLLRLLRLQTNTPLMEVMASLGLGVCVWIALLWTAAVAGVLIAPVGWALAAIVLAIGYRDVRYWLAALVRPSSEVTLSWRDLRLFLLWLLFSYLALNFLTVVRPFPIGWDDLGSYMNRPRLMVSYGHFIFSMAPFMWEYVTSLGFLLFGYQSDFGATISMMVNWTAGLLAVVVVYGFTRTFLGHGRGLLAALLYYTLPLVGHFSFADMKVDNAIFAVGALATYATFVYLFPVTQEGEEAAEPPSPRWLLLAGLFAGFAFAMKPTAIMVGLTLPIIIAGAAIHWTAFVGAGLLAAFILLRQQNLVPAIAQRVAGSAEVLSPSVVYLAIILCALVFFAVGLRKRREQLRAIALPLALFFVGVFVAVTPWILHNNFLRGQYFPPRLELGAINEVTPYFDIKGTSTSGGGNRPFRQLPQELLVNKDDPSCTSQTGGKEELDRYWGYATGWGHYLTLPWRTVMNSDSAGYYVTSSPALFLFLLLLLLPYFWLKRGRWLRWFWFFTAALIVEWVFLCNGIIWYGIGMFLGIAVGLEALIATTPDKLSRTAAGTLVALALLTSFSMRFWQFEQQYNMLEYPLGKITAEALQARTIPHYESIARQVTERHAALSDRPYVYRIGTFIPYFIPKNLEVIGTADQQLDFFNCLFAERDTALTVKRLKALGFNSIIFDTNTATIESDQNGSLHQKVDAFLTFANTPNIGLEPIVVDPEGGIAFLLIQ